MARLTKELTTDMISVDELTNPMVIVVDMINGFVNEGALADSAINGTVPTIEKLLKTNIPNLFAVDAHDEDANEFRSFPKHCIKGSKESEIIPELKSYAKEIVYKNSTNLAHAINMEEFVKKADTFIITGCCTDICVMQFALALRTYLNQFDYGEKEVILVSDAVDTYHIDGVHDAVEYNRMALLMMQQSGIRVVKGVQ